MCTFAHSLHAETSASAASNGQAKEVEYSRRESCHFKICLIAFYFHAWYPLRTPAKERERERERERENRAKRWGRIVREHWLPLSHEARRFPPKYLSHVHGSMCHARFFFTLRASTWFRAQCVFDTMFAIAEVNCRRYSLVNRTWIDSKVWVRAALSTHWARIEQWASQRHSKTTNPLISAHHQSCE
jgi:hypothetical protein